MNQTRARASEQAGKESHTNNCIYVIAINMKSFGDSLVFCIFSTVLCFDLVPLYLLILLVTYVSFDEHKFKKPLIFGFTIEKSFLWDFGCSCLRILVMSILSCCFSCNFYLLILLEKCNRKDFFCVGTSSTNKGMTR